MASIELCVELASQDQRWDQYDDATRAALVIIQDCLDRRGIKHEFRNIDEDVLDEIADTWAEIIRSVLHVK
jgi:hypothetical protein